MSNFKSYGLQSIALTALMFAASGVQAANDDGLFCACVYTDSTEFLEYEKECAGLAANNGYARSRIRATRRGDTYNARAVPIFFPFPACTDSVDAKAACIDPFTIKGAGREAYICVGSPSQLP